MAAWPEIEGIDADDARARWCGDAALFARILAQMFERFGDDCRPSGAVDPDEIGDAARRMHKLRGAAASLGAKSVFFIAGQLEAAYLTVDLELATHLRARLAESLCRLRDAASPVLEKARPLAGAGMIDAAAAGTDACAGRGGPGRPRDLERLAELLRRQDLAALALSRSVSIELERLLGVDPYRRMVEHIENLRFEQACRDLSAVLG